MSDIPGFPYADLWQERVIRSVANLTREDGERFLAHAGRLALRVDATPMALADANAALDRVREGSIQGAAVLVPPHLS
jgi:propanol-preferring alcohol dehydrogenase